MADLIVSFLSSVPPEVLAKFHDKPLTLAVPAAPIGQGRVFYADWLSKVRDGKGNVVPGMFKMAGGGAGPIGRVAVIGFSNGVDSGVSQVLDANDAQRLDFVGAFDGIHGSFVPATTQLMPSTYSKWIAYALLAASSKPSHDPSSPVMVISHSSIEPTFPSTTETAGLIWNEILKRAPVDYESTYWSELDQIVYPGGMTIKSANTGGGGVLPSWTWESFADGWYDRRVCNGLSVFGWGDPGKSPKGRFNARTRDQYNGTADHIFQAHAVLPAVLSTYLAARWNPSCGPLTGLGGPEGCVPGDGRKYDAGPDGPLASPFLGGISLPTAPAACPYPPPGSVIVGDRLDPCRTSDKPGSSPLPATPIATTTTGKILAGTLGAVLGYGAARYLLGRSGRSARSAT